MSTKDYIILAKAIALMPDNVRPAVANSIGDALRVDNYRFNWNTWFAACGVLDNDRGKPFPESK
jgi:hypothetical protein